VVAFGEALKKMGAQIDGLGTRTIEIQGVDALTPIEVRNTPDRIEMGTFMILAAMAGEPGEPFEIKNGNHQHLGQAFKDYFRGTGADTKYTDDGAVVTPPETVTPVSIRTETYPGFPTDLQAQWTVMLATAEGEATVTDTIYDDRFKHVPELQRLGIDVTVDGNAATVRGGQPIKGAQVMSTDLRASVSLVMAGIVASGRTDVLRIYHLDRGYENLATKLRSAGARIERQQYDEFAEPERTK